MHQELVRDLASRVNSFPTPTEDVEKEGLITTWEMNVLELMAQGYSDKDIAKTLNIANTTVRNHIKSILHKLGAKNRTQAVYQAQKFNIL